jgi:ADP-ribose pyrophosphatase YjhB (NUDIX family)
MGRVEYHHDASAPRANSLVPAASAIVVDGQGRVLLHRRSDNELWSIPGGAMEIGESIGQTVVREVREETGLEVEPRRIVGVYTDPGHVVAYDGEVRQQFSVCIECRVAGGTLTISDESLDVGSWLLVTSASCRWQSRSNSASGATSPVALPSSLDSDNHPCSTDATISASRGRASSSARATTWSSQ